MKDQYITHASDERLAEMLEPIGLDIALSNPEAGALLGEIARCHQCHFLNWYFIDHTHVSAPWFCGLHGGALVDPDGEQQDLDHHGGCGFMPLEGSRQLRLFI